MLDREVESKGGRSGCFQADLLSSGGTDLVDAFVERFDGIDVLVNNAGAICGFEDFLNLDETAWSDTFLCLVDSVFLYPSPFVISALVEIEPND